MRNEDFICENCNKQINSLDNGSARNHCSYCLYSKHLDNNFPGDRKSECRGLMIAIDIDYKKNKGYMLKHKCLKCNKIILNKTAPDDNILDLTNKINQNKIYGNK